MDVDQRYRYLRLLALGSVLSAILVAAVTLSSLHPCPPDLAAMARTAGSYTFLDRHGERLNVSYTARWNHNDQIAFHDTPLLLRDAFISAEDKRFFDHGGVDWLARGNALLDNLRAGRTVRGASTITEQVVRMLHPRPRSLWSRWLEGFEAMVLERQHDKIAILQFYLNQVPYRARRRGVVQAARYYFDRDLSTLNDREILSLAVLVRSPRWFDPWTRGQALRDRVDKLAARLDSSGQLDLDRTRFEQQRLSLRDAHPSFRVQHFIRHAKQDLEQQPSLARNIHTTIDAALQRRVQAIIDARLERLSDRQVGNGAALIVDHDTNEILSWVVGFAGRNDKPFNELNAVTVARQPGSTLKPLLYTAALKRGWTAATMLRDEPLEEGVGLGMHRYHNYSRAHYGLISLREALGNSLNIPAVRAIQFVGPGTFLNFLRDAGIENLSGHPNVYGDGIALGNGEISLYELVQAYTVLARMGDFKALSYTHEAAVAKRSYRVVSEDVASLIADILSDPRARAKEFGAHSILNFPFQTAVKTGTSSDYRDAWAVGYNDRYTVGVWLGNLDYAPMNEVTGSTGPALALRSIFNELNRHRQPKPLFFSNKLVKKSVCYENGELADRHCEARDEWFVAGTDPTSAARSSAPVRLRKPSPGLLLALDPRIPEQAQYFEFAITEHADIAAIEWYVDDRLVGRTNATKFAWKIAAGAHRAYARVVMRDRQQYFTTESVRYDVK